MANRIFVFGSNEAGRHGAGAALWAKRFNGAQQGISYGHHGDSFAIPTKNQKIQPLDQFRINEYVQGFLAYAAGHPEMTFQVSRIGCGLAGFEDKDIAPMFKTATQNCLFDDVWEQYLPAHLSFWGTY